MSGSEILKSLPTDTCYHTCRATQRENKLDTNDRWLDFK